MIKSSSDNYSKSWAECLLIGLRLYIGIKFYNNLVEATIANELVTRVFFTQNFCISIYLTNLCLVCWPALLVIPWVLQTLCIVDISLTGCYCWC